DAAATMDEELLIVVQVNGKLRGKVTVPACADEGTVKEKAMADAKVLPFLEGKKVKKVICIPGRLINIVVS
ncbi:MAG TPA: hypothetical protein VHN12_08170, partial [Geobacteraceae bacterium]|nr:hypothetical protein [Geobacteraceae bacterium]